MRSERHRRYWALALMIGLLWATGNGCRRVTSPEVDGQTQSLELQDILLDIVWPDEGVLDDVRIRYSNEFFVGISGLPRVSETFTAEKESDLLLPGRPNTRFMLRVTWTNSANFIREWPFGPFDPTADELPVDLRTPNLWVRPRLRLSGDEIASRKIWGRVWAQNIEGYSLSGAAEGDSVLAFRLPSVQPSLALKWSLSEDPDSVNYVDANYHGDLALDQSVALDLDVYPVFVRVNSRLPAAVVEPAQIYLFNPSSGDWTDIESSSHWTPGEVVELWAREPVLRLDADLPSGWGDATVLASRWVAAAPGDTVDFDIGVLDLRLRCLTADSMPIAHAPVELSLLNASGGYGAISRVTDAAGEIGCLVNPGLYELDLDGYWQRRFEVRSDTLVVLRESS